MMITLNREDDTHVVAWLRKNCLASKLDFTLTVEGVSVYVDVDINKLVLLRYNNSNLNEYIISDGILKGCRVIREGNKFLLAPTRNNRLKIKQDIFTFIFEFEDKRIDLFINPYSHKFIGRDIVCTKEE